MKEKILSREGISLAQERDVLNLSLTGRPYEMEDRRRTKRSASKSKSLSDESTPAPESAPVTMDTSPMPPQLPPQPHSYGMMNMPAIMHSIHPTSAIPPIAPHGFNVTDAVTPGVTAQESLPLGSTSQALDQNGQLPNASQSFFELFATDIRDGSYSSII